MFSHTLAPGRSHFCLRIVFLLLALFIFSPVSAAQGGERQICEQRLRQSLRLNTDWLLNGQQENGLFTYELKPLDQVKPETNNMVRQIGTFWGLIRMQEFDGRSEIKQAISRFRNAIRRYIKKGNSPGGEIAYIEFNNAAKLNSAALYLLALASMKQAGMVLTPEEQEIAPLLINGLKQMANGKGGFWYIYYLDEKHNRITSYGSAEAIYALAMWAHVTGDDDLRDYARATFMAYYDHYLRDLDEFENTLFRAWFSWALHAQSLLGAADEEDRYKYYIRPMLALALAHRAANPTCAEAGCIMGPTASDAPFLEGIVAAYPIAKRHEQDEYFVNAIENYIARALPALLSLQATADSTELLEKSPHAPEALIGGICFDPGCSFMRNDLNQHAMIAMLNYTQTMCPAREPPATHGQESNAAH
ncbi:MAG: hypothetical protein AB7H77_11760 [Bdellovibrionales bacterium]